MTNSGTLGLNWNVAPTNTNTANAIVKRDGSGSFGAANIAAVYVTASNPAGVAIAASTAAPSGAILGTNTGTSAVADGVDGVSASAFAAGVAGINNNGGYGLYGSGGTGTYGISTKLATGLGVFGGVGNESSTGLGFGGGVGVLGDGGGLGIGVAGTVDDGNAGYFINNSPSGQTTFYVYAGNSATSTVLTAYNLATQGGCSIESNGSVSCTGVKSAVVPVDDGSRKVALYAVEAPENWFEDFGSGKLSGGVASITLEPTFAQTVNTGVEYHVFLTPRGECEGLYVANATATGFEVRELHRGSSNVAFDYRIVARRKGYENIRLADKTKLFEAPKLSRRPASGKTTFVKPRAVSKLGVVEAPQLTSQ